MCAIGGDIMQSRGGTRIYLGACVELSLGIIGARSPTLAATNNHNLAARQQAPLLLSLRFHGTA